MSKAERYYAQDRWDIDSWVDIISVEYETLTEAYPFTRAFRSMSSGGAVDLLDVGCGTAIFPSYLDGILPPDVNIRADLWDISGVSLREARRVMDRLSHFTVGEARQAQIEEIPSRLDVTEPRYGIIWAIHSFTTVDVASMGEVYASLVEGLVPGGHLLVYQLTAESSYQRLHGHYLLEHGGQPFMEFEDSARILDSLGAAYDVYPQQFDHEVPGDRAEVLEKYLRKCILDDSADVLQLFAPLLEDFHDSGTYVFPQTVNLIDVSK